MRRTLAVTLAAVSLALFASPAMAVSATHIAIDDFFFSPQTKTVPVASSLPLEWDNGGSFAHTATSDVNGFFDTGQIPAGNTGVDSLAGAGTYKYHCTNHSTMHGTLKVRPTVSAASIGVGDPVTITFGIALQKGFTFDLERRRNGGDWITMRSQTDFSSATFTPSRTGTYDFRARTHNPLGKVSGYSPMRTVTVS
jgi:plastocyanin